MKNKKGIWLIVLIITIIVIIILAAAIILSISKNNPITNANKAVNENDLKTAQEAVVAWLGDRWVSDIDGDGIADGIIVADISQESTDTTNTYKGGNPWGDSWGSFSYTAQTTGLKSYSEDTSYKYTNPDGSQVDGTLITCTNNSGTPQYYILSLANYDSNTHYWYKNAYGKMSDYSKFTSQDFGKGKENTEKMIDRMKNHSDTSKYSVDYGEATTGTNADVWSIIQDKANEGWFVPSRVEWAAFASYLNPSNTSGDANYYVNYGLSSWYWSSAQYNTNNAYEVLFINGDMNCSTVRNYSYVRLASTF